ncbi:hypothetical protein HYX05_00930 [Candidatus Woesearchaeota archaeon]|nr:hypothetical protein [Candidatus Woesearchaeota archaeon]
MRKNRLIWSFGLFLIAIISLPIAHAQTLFESPIFFILINSLIVGVVLFILQSVLMPQKNPKEQTAVWVAILVGSLLIGFMFGRSGFIWNHPVFAKFFSIYVLVNAVVIGIILYFLFGFLDINKKLGSPEGKGGLGIIIFLIAALFAVQIGNQWIWQKAVVRQFIDYLFGSQGILNPAPPEYRLWAFITVTTLLSFFFKGYLLPTGAGGTDKVNYALAILIGSSVARAGISFASIVLLGEAIFTIVLAKALQGTAPDVKGKSTNWILAAFLVGWASAAMTYGTEYQGWLAWIVGTPLWAMGLIQVGPTGAAAQPSGTGWFGWIFKMGGGALVIAIIALILLFVIARGEKRSKAIKEGLTRIMIKVSDWLSRSETAIDVLGKWWSFRNPTLEREMPTKLKDLRLEIYTLMNWMLRYDVWHSKYLAFDVLVKKIEKEEAELLQKTVYIRESPAKSIKKIVEGSNIIKNPSTGFWELEPGVEVLDDGSEEVGHGKPGIGRQYWIVYKLANFLKENLEKDLRNLPDSPNDARIEIEAGETAKLFNKEISAHRTSINDYYSLEEEGKGRYHAGFKRFGLASWIRSYYLYFIDMYNMYGTYKRGFFFAKPDAVPDYYDYTTTSNNRGITRDITINKNKVIRAISLEERRIYKSALNKKETDRTPVENLAVEKVNKYKKQYLKLRRNFEKDNYLLELDIFGYCLQDWNAVAVDGATKMQVNYIRRYHREDMWELYQPMDVEPRARFSTMLSWSLKDWEYAARDFARGSFHPFSKRWADYSFIPLKGLMDYSKATFKSPLNPDELGFDREAMKNSHDLGYWGRKYYWDEKGQNLLTSTGIVNPYPALSVEGLWEFVTNVAKRKIKEPQEAEKFVHTFQMEFELLEKLKKGERSG